MNELLGWYGYENVDRGDLGRASKQLAADTQKAKTSKSLHTSNQIRMHKTPALNVNPLLRPDKSSTTPSTPDRPTNNSSPESSSRYSKSPAALVGSSSELVIDEKKGNFYM